MSVNFLNQHCKDGEPLGPDAEYYTDLYIKTKQQLQQARRQGWEQCQREAKDKAEAFTHAGKLCCMEKVDKIKDAITSMEYKGVEK